MRTSIILLISFLSCVLCCNGPPTPTLVPFGGISSSLPSTSYGQLVQGISDISSFSFKIAATCGQGGDIATAYIAPWGDSSPSSPLGSTTVTLPSPSSGYVDVVATFKVYRLDPEQQYVIVISFTATSCYEILTQFAAGAGGFVKAKGGVWKSGCGEDAVFALSFESRIEVNPDLNYATGHEQAGTWHCLNNVTFSCLQVNWQTGQVNTFYAPCYALRSVLYSDGALNCNNQIVMYGCLSACWDAQYQHAWSYGNCDISGTPYKFASDSWNWGGFLASGFADYSNNNQSVALAASGDCGSTQPKLAPNEVTPGFFIPIVRRTPFN